MSSIYYYLPMNIEDLASKLQAKVIYQASNSKDLPIQNCIVSDMMSEVLVDDKENTVLITSLATPQTLHTASSISALCVIIVNNKPIPKGTRELASELDINLLVTKLAAFETCIILGKLLQK